MKALLLLLVGLQAQAQDYALILPTPSPYYAVPNAVTTITPRGVYQTIQSPRYSVTVGPDGVYQTFKGTNMSVTTTPKGEQIISIEGRQRMP